MKPARADFTRWSRRLRRRRMALDFLALLGLLLSTSANPTAALAAPTCAPRIVATERAPIDPEGYRRHLRAVLADLEGGGQGEAGRVATRLRSAGPVVLPNGTPVRPDLEDTLAYLEDRPPDVVSARASLRALLAELDRSQTLPAFESGRDPRQQLENVLARREFRPEPEPDASSRWYQQLRDVLLGWLGSLLAPVWVWLSERWGQVWGEGIKREVWQTAATMAGLALVVGLILWVARGLRRAVGSAPSRIASGRAARRADADAVRAEALRMAQGGDFRRAMRGLYLAVLMRLEEQGKLRFDRSLTNREVLARAAGGGEKAVVEQLAPLVERFDRFWYGAAVCSVEDYTDFARLTMAAWGQD